MNKNENLYASRSVKSLSYYLVNIMRVFLLLITIGLSSAFANTTTAQTKIDVNVNNVTLEELFKDIQSKSEFIFFYKDNVLKYNVTLNVKNASVTAILDSALKGTNLTYKVNDRQVIIKESPNNQNQENNLKTNQQTKTITGTVLDDIGGPLVGATVQAKGTNVGVATDFDGNFSITVADDTKFILISYIGFATQEIDVTSTFNIEVKMLADSSALEEIVIIGYGTEQKSLLSDAVTSIKSSQVSDLPVPSVDGLLQGQAAGVQVQQNSGTPGGEMSVRIRGLSSISGSNQPLYIIDGIPVTSGDFGQLSFSGQGASALSDLNPSDIESISVLKDASATAIYGARGSNGIVLITTKRGKEQKSVVSVNVYSGVQQAWNKLDMLNAKEWMEYRNDLAGTTVFTPEDIANNTVDTDWQDVIFRTASINSYEASARGGSEKTQFFISGTFLEQEGILIGTDYQRMNARVNVDHQLSDKVKIGTSIGLTHAKTNRVESDQTLHGPLPNGISTPAIFSVYNEDGSYNQSGPYSNALSIANEAISENFSYRTNSNAYLDWQIIEDLSFSTKWGVDFLNFREHSYESTQTVQGARYNGLGFEAYSNVSNIVSNNLLKYKKKFNKHKVEALVGYTFEKYQYRSSFIRGQDFADDNLEYISSAATIVSASANASDEGIRSYLGRLNYNFDDKYIASVTGRFDTSTKFGENNRTGFFPAASVAWRAIQEDFFQDQDIVSDLKFRVSYGLTGNDDISPFLFSELYGNTSYDGQPAIYPSNIPNPDLKWESTAQLNIGINVGLFEDRITLTADYYNKQTNDLLLSRPLPSSSGFSSITENVGKVENKGIELSIETRNFIKENFTWSTQFNISGNRNKVLELYNDQPIDDIGRGGNRIMEGQPIGIFYSYKSLGVDPSTGDIVYADTNFDGEITSADRTIVGNPHPDFIYGITNNFTYKGFDATIFLQGSYGNDVFNGSRLFLESLQGGDNQVADITRRWQQPGDITDIPRATTDPVASAQNKRVSSRFIEDGSYLRVKNVTIGYTLDKSVMEKTMFSSFRVYLSAQNLFTFTNYSGLDPEVNYRGDDNSVIGTDFFTYPQAQVFTLGVNLKF
ncbi:TonB-dependent receptor [Winogradskyella psychrotolerans RS-3]|uniref:TonB-dependent receptor n=1 Tax=Winogradskyella psychrotolerans RS-3 TaxID=641526 RepID=S7VM08_9FLAO|nr:TonB-dependent receptor [Winogradskyella psychrotolerans]EPR71200.1 TonB-dependent receptor [Winogradskyella psychrotolerans RS-3]